MKVNKQYTSIAKKFLDQYKNPNLKRFLESTMPNQSPNFYFNVKSEILRLSKLCNRILDLRDKIKNEEIHEIEYNNQTHYLNDTGLREFQRVIEIYDNRFTFGVYEAVLEKVKEAQEQEKLLLKEALEEKKVEPKTLEYINFNEFNFRNEERMFFAVEIKIYEKTEKSLLEDIKRIKGYYNRNEYLDHKKGLTCDISLSGLNIKVPESTIYEVGKQIIVRMTGIEKEVIFNTPYIEYEVVKVQHKGKFNYISLKKIDNELSKEVELYITNIINGYKKKYKVDLSHVVKSIRSKGYEQYYMSKLNDASFLFSTKKQFLIPKIEYVYDKENSKFQSLKENNYLSKAFLHSKMHTFTKEKQGYFYFLTFNFIHNGKKLFYSLSTNDLSDLEITKFISYGVKKKTIKIFKCSYRKIDVLEDAFVKSSLPINVLKNISPHSLKLSPKVESILKDIEYIINFNDITELLDFDFYMNIPSDNTRIKDLNHCLVKDYPLDPIIEIETEKQDFRIEDRFSYNMNVTVTYKGKQYNGYTTDVSVKGLRIKLDEKIFFERNPKIKVTFEDHTNQVHHSLDNLDYRVVNSKERILFCSASGDLSKHGGVLFLKKFIYKNYYRMKTTGNSNQVLGLTESVKNIVSKNYTNLPIFFELKNKQVNPFMVAGYEDFMIEFDLFKHLGVNKSNLNKTLRPLFFNQNFVEKIQEAYQSLDEENKCATLNYYINIKQGISRPLFKFLFEEQVGSSKEKDLFLHPEDGSKTFVFRIKLSKKDRMFNKYFKHEIMYVESYYSHKAEEIYNEFKRVAGVIEFSDVTNVINSENKKTLSGIS
tara:strand:- start:18307 stop:20763 length:2457 start_codon:yes stop_codon:yes gene_type:complete